MASLSTWVIRAVRRFGWAPAGFFLLHVVLVAATSAYTSVPYMDSWMHLGGAMLITWFFRRAAALPEAVPVLGTLTRFGRDAFAWTALGMAIVAWEGAEWVADELFGAHFQQGLHDTMLDMAVGVCGGTLLLALRALARRAA